ncbi:mediator of RNA polymerase II transcription subunit 8 [Chamberlinius hualienensis]
MQREEKVMEVALDTLIARVADLKNSVVALLMKLDHEHETVQWPTMLDNFALLSGQANSLLKVLKNDKTPLLRNFISLPIRLNPDRDEELVKLTENRVGVFNHEVPPDYLRTKPDPDVELREQHLLQRANQLIAEAGPASKQINFINKVVNQTLDMVNSARDKWENDATTRSQASVTSTAADTAMLIAAVNSGKGLKIIKPTGQGPSLPGQVPQSSQSQMSSIGGSVVGKVPSAIKTNIKSASSIHPYSR